MPYPPHSGGQLREYELLNRLAPRFRILLHVVTGFLSEDILGVARLQEICDAVCVLPAEPEPDSHVPARVWQQRSPAMRDEVGRCLRSSGVDLIHIEGYYMRQHLPKCLPVPLALVEENIEFELDLQRARLSGESGSPLCGVAEDLERATWREATAFGVLTPEDRDRTRQLEPGIKTALVPNGFDHVRVRNAALETPSLRVGFLANFSYPPSRDAANHLLEKLWPRISAACPDAELRLVGAGMPSDLQRRIQGLEGVSASGPVKDVADELQRMHVMLAPLRVGGGIKVKVLEAMACGVPVVTTPLGAQGIPPRLKSGMAIGVREDDLIEATLTRLLHPEYRQDAYDQIPQLRSAIPSWDDAADALAGLWRRALLVREPRE
jgi:glycosyltransferase involved in cell wall biosynthesis